MSFTNIARIMVYLTITVGAEDYAALDADGAII
jgi:hypothetical protein